MVLPSLYYRYEPARALEWFRSTFVACDPAYSMEQASIWQEYVELFGDSPVRPLDAAKLFARMREPFPSTIIGKAKNGSFRVFGLGRVDKSDVRVRSLKALYDARTKENGQRRRAVNRADHETGYVMAPKAMLGEKPAGKGVSDTRESTGKNGATPTRVKEGAGSRPLSAVKKETRTPAQIAAAQYKDEWSMFSDTTWAPNVGLRFSRVVWSQSYAGL